MIYCSSDGSAVGHQFLQVVILATTWKVVGRVQISGMWLQNSCSLWETKWSVFDSNLHHWSWQHHVFKFQGCFWPSQSHFMVWKSKCQFIWQNRSHIYLIIFSVPLKIVKLFGVGKQHLKKWANMEWLLFPILSHLKH